MTSPYRQEQEQQSASPARAEALECSVRVPLTAEQLRAVRAIDGYDLWFVTERLGRKGLPAGRAEAAVTEFKKYMALFALGYENLGMISDEVDEVWHGFILFTKAYTEFCANVFGRYIHHAPNTSRNPQLTRECVLNFTGAYERVFGELHAVWRSEELERMLSGASRTPGECHTAPRDDPALGAAAPGECSVNPDEVPALGHAVGYSAVGECGANDYPL